MNIEPADDVAEKVTAPAYAIGDGAGLCPVVTKTSEDPDTKLPLGIVEAVEVLMPKDDPTDRLARRILILNGVEYDVTFGGRIPLKVDEKYEYDPTGEEPPPFEWHLITVPFGSRLWKQP